MKVTLQKRIIFICLLLFAVCVTACRRVASAEGTAESRSPVPAEEELRNDALPDVPDSVPKEETNSGQAEQAEQAGQPEDVQFGKNLFTIDNGETVWLSITEEKLMEFADYFRRELALNDAAISGILANLQEESGFNPNKIGDLGAAYGICQWRGDRLNQMVKYCEAQKLNPVSMEGQLAFLVYDLKENYIYPYDLLRCSPDSEQGALQATYDFCAYYEVPSDPSQESQERERLTRLLIYPTLSENRKNGS